MKASTTYIIMGIIGLLIVVGGLLYAVIDSMPKPDVKEVQFKSVERNGVYTNVNIDIIANNSFTCYIEDFAIYSDNLPVAAKYFLEGNVSSTQLQIKNKTNPITIVFTMPISSIDQPIKLTYKGEFFT